MLSLLAHEIGFMISGPCCLIVSGGENEIKYSITLFLNAQLQSAHGE